MSTSLQLQIIACPTFPFLYVLSWLPPTEVKDMACPVKQKKCYSEIDNTMKVMNVDQKFAGQLWIFQHFDCPFPTPLHSSCYCRSPTLCHKCLWGESGGATLKTAA